MKTLEEFVALFAEQFDDTDASEITSTTAFRDLDVVLAHGFILLRVF